MKYRLLPVFAAAALLATGCTASASEEPSASADESGTDSRLAEITERGTLQVCTTGDYRPFTYKDPDTGEWSGIDISMAQDLAARLEVDVEFVQTSWKDLMPDFLAGCDIGLGGVSISLARAEQAFYTDPVLDDGKTPITLCGNEELYDTVGRSTPRASGPSPRLGARMKSSRTRTTPRARSSASRTTTRSSTRSSPAGRT